MANAVLFQNLDCFIHGVPFRNAAEIEFHAWNDQAHGVVLQLQLFVADSLPSFGEAFRIRKLLFAARFAPKINARANGDVESAIAELRESLRGDQDLP